MKNRKGALGGQILGFPVLVILMIIVGGSISYMTALFFGGSYDFRGTEADLLSYKVRNCLVDSSNIDGLLSNEGFFSGCGLDEKIIRENSIIRICKNAKNCFLDDKSFSIGSDFNQCLLDGSKDNRNFYLCSTSKFERNGENFDIITGTKQSLIRGAG